MTLPEGWRRVTLGEVADTALGKMLDRGRSRGLSEVRYLRNVNVQWGRVDTHDLLTMELADDERQRFGVEAGDLLVCEGGEIGRAAIWRGDGEYIAFQKALHRIRPSADLDSSFLRYALELFASNGTLARFSTGSTIAHLPQRQLRLISLPLPPIDEQRRIVDILEEQLARLQAADVSLGNSRARAKRLLSSQVSRLLSGRSVDLGVVTDVQGGIQKQARRAPVENAYPFLRVANVTATGLDLRDVHAIELFSGEIERYRLRDGDLLVVEGNGSPSQIGRSALWDGSIDDAVHQNHLIRVRPRSGLLPKYLELAWNSEGFRSELRNLASSSSGLYTLSVRKLLQLKLSVPDEGRQQEVTERVDRLRAAVDRADRAVDAANRRGVALRHALLEAAFSGRLTGYDSDLTRAEELA